MPEDAWMCDSVEEGIKAGLLALMSGISEDYWCAGWLSGLEYDLWRAREFDTTLRPIVPHKVAELLRRLSDEADGWWRWNDGPVFVRMTEWLEIVRSRSASTAGEMLSEIAS